MTAALSSTNSLRTASKELCDSSMARGVIDRFPRLRSCSAVPGTLCFFFRSVTSATSMVLSASHSCRKVKYSLNTLVACAETERRLHLCCTLLDYRECIAIFSAAFREHYGIASSAHGPRKFCRWPTLDSAHSIYWSICLSIYLTIYLSNHRII